VHNALVEPGRAQVEFAFYESGHMTYLENRSLAKATQHPVRFMQAAGSGATTPTR
jgi:hypothetical protein